MIRGRLGWGLGIALLGLFIGLAPLRHRVIDTMAGAGSFFVYPCAYVGSLIVKPCSEFYRRLQFFYACEEMYVHLFADYRTLLDAHTKLVSEMVHCKETTQFVVRYAQDTLFARVLMRRYDTSMHRIMVDCGTLVGIGEDVPVLDGFSLVGRVCAVSPLYAWVQTVSDPHTRIPVYIGSRAVRGIYQGTGDTQHGRVLYVSHLEPVALGDIVLTAGDGGVYPEGFAVGRISGIEKEGFTYVLDVDIMAQLESIDRCSLYVHAALPTTVQPMAHEN